MIRFPKVSTALFALSLITGSAQASLDAISRIPNFEPRQNLHQFKPVVVVIFLDLHSQQERVMSELTKPKSHQPPEVSPPNRRTMPTPQRSRRTLAERSLERRQLPQTEQPKADVPEKRTRQAPPEK